MGPARAVKIKGVLVVTDRSLDLLIDEVVLGLAEEADVARLEALAQADPAIAARLARARDGFGALDDTADALPVPEGLWDRIAAQLSQAVAGEAIRQMLQQLEAAERQPALQGFIRSLLSIWPGHSVRKAAEGLEEELTEREREVVCLAAKGMSNDEIGKQLSLALGTVKWHLHNIYEKLKVRNRTQAIRRVRELSLLEP